jgi:DNA-binding NarL/FixJ family response regulator
VPDPIRVLLVDDHALTRRGLAAVFSIEDDIVVVGEAATADEAVSRAEEMVPDVVLMDIRMPGGSSGIDACATIKDRVPSAQIIMLTASDEELDVLEALRAGATGYLTKDLVDQDVAEAVRQVAAGHSPIRPDIAGRLLTEMVQRPEDTAPVRSAELTPRELQVLRLVADGLSNKDIAAELFISENTVKNHVRNILEKLHKHSRMEAVVYAVREKMLELN